MNLRSKTRLKLLPFAAGLTLLMSGCAMTSQTSGATAIEALCAEWKRSLPTRSRSDTQQTQDEIGRAYDVYEAACQDSL